MSYLIFNQQNSDPSSPASGKTNIYTDNGAKGLVSKTDAGVIRRYAQDALTSVTAATGAITTLETVIAGGNGNARIYANSLQVGSTIRCTLQGTCTTTVANASTWRFRIGTLGTTSDGVVMSAANSVAGTTGTAIPFVARLVMTVRTIGAAATAQGFLELGTTGNTGISAVTWQCVQGTMTNFNSTVDNWLSATYVSAAVTTSATFQMGFIEMVKL